MLDESWCRGKRTSTYGVAAKLVMHILTCLFIYLTRRTLFFYFLHLRFWERVG